MKKTKRFKWFVTAAILAVNAVLWAVPSPLAYLVAQQREVMLGRYGESRMTALLILIPISILLVCAVWAKEKNKRQQQFKIFALVISVIITLIVMDLALRVIERKPYVGNPLLYHHVPNTVDKGVIHDVPENAFSYPYTPAGYPDFSYTHTIDKRGFRNQTDLEKYDIIVLGDSFAEGSHVSDDQTWPVLLAKQTGKNVYNLGISGGNPATYLEIMKTYALPLKPKLVLCMIYEGNDFRGSNFNRKPQSLRSRWRRFIKLSPLRLACKRAMIRTLTPLGSHRFSLPVPAQPHPVPVCPADHSLWPVAWQPLGVPDGPNMKFYSFDLKRLQDHYINPELFAKSTACRGTLDALREIKRLCTENQIRLIVMFAPDTPHVILPLAKDRLDPAQVRAFMALKIKNLPPSETIMNDLIDRLAIKETIVERFCEEENIEFISLTEPLRQKAEQGVQVYLTYNQHWTPPGNAVAADTVTGFLKQWYSK